jgi:hypothetical protein
MTVMGQSSESAFEHRSKIAIAASREHRDLKAEHTPVPASAHTML